MEKFENLKTKIEIFRQEIIKKTLICNKKACDFLNRENNNIEEYFYFSMAKEELKLFIHNNCMSIIREYNLLCDKNKKITPIKYYPPLIEECDRNITINLRDLLHTFDVTKGTVFDFSNNNVISVKYYFHC